MCLDFARHSESISSRSILQILFLLQKPEVISFFWEMVGGGA